MKTVSILSLLCLPLALQAQVAVVDKLAIYQLILQVMRLGDPALIRYLPGFDPVHQSLADPGRGIPLEQIQELASGPNALAYDGNGLYRSIPQLITTPDGQAQVRVEVNYRKYDALAGAAANYRTVYDDTESRRFELRQAIRNTTAAVQGATTVAETDKLKALLAAQAAELAALDRERDAAAAHVMIQEAENRNDQARQAEARAEDQAAAFKAVQGNLARFLKPSTGPVRIPTTRRRQR